MSSRREVGPSINQERSSPSWSFRIRCVLLSSWSVSFQPPNQSCWSWPTEGGEWGKRSPRLCFGDQESQPEIGLCFRQGVARQYQVLISHPKERGSEDQFDISFKREWVIHPIPMFTGGQKREEKNSLAKSQQGRRLPQRGDTYEKTTSMPSFVDS